MSFEVVKSKVCNRARNRYYHDINYANNDEGEGEKYFNIRIKNKNYPSCYTYNVLIMLAKRLINEDKVINYK